MAIHKKSENAAKSFRSQTQILSHHWPFEIVNCRCLHQYNASNSGFKYFVSKISTKFAIFYTHSKTLKTTNRAQPVSNFRRNQVRVLMFVHQIRRRWIFTKSLFLQLNHWGVWNSEISCKMLLFIQHSVSCTDSNGSQAHELSRPYGFTNHIMLDDKFFIHWSDAVKFAISNNQHMVLSNSFYFIVWKNITTHLPVPKCVSLNYGFIQIGVRKEANRRWPALASIRKCVWCMVYEMLASFETIPMTFLHQSHSKHRCGLYCQTMGPSKN